MWKRGKCKRKREEMEKKGKKWERWWVIKQQTRLPNP
jgi:hypothetical protein